MQQALAARSPHGTTAVFLCRACASAAAGLLLLAVFLGCHWVTAEQGEEAQALYLALTRSHMHVALALTAG